MFDVLTILPMACGDACEPRKTIPRSFLWSFGIAAINAMLLAVVVTCNAPGISYFAPPEANALSYGYASGLHVTRTAAKLFGIPACIATGLFIDVVMLVSFLRFRKHLSSLPCMFTQPLGTNVVYYSLTIFVSYVGAILVFFPLFAVMIVLFAIYLVFLTVWYFWQVNSRQVFSLQEQKVMFQAYVINANVTRRRRKQRTLPSSNAMNTPTLSPSPSDNHIQRGCLVGLSGAVAYMSRMFRIRKQMSFTANLSSTSMAVVKKSKLKKDENSYRDYIPEDDTKSAPYLPQREEERNATTSVYVAYDRNSIFNISSESIDCQVKNHPTYDYQSKQHPRSFRYQVAPDNDMMEDCVGPLP
eukprot:gene10267-11363_t